MDYLEVSRSIVDFSQDGVTDERREPVSMGDGLF
jgi:hypothetical protein